MDSQSVAKKHDHRHAMLFDMPQMERRGESHHATFCRTDCVMSQKNICLQNKLESVRFYDYFAECEMGV